MSSISVQCAQCKRRLSAKPQLAGKRVKCPGCGAPIVVPDPSAIRTIEVQCEACFSEFLANSTDVGTQVTCPACGCQTAVGGSGSGVSPALAADPLSDSASAAESPIATRSLGSKYGKPTQVSRFGAEPQSLTSSLLARFGFSAAAAGGALIALVVLLISGRAMAGAVVCGVGLAMAGIGFLVPAPPKSRFRTDASNTGLKIAAGVGLGLFLLMTIAARVVRSAALHEAVPGDQRAGVIFAILFAMLAFSGLLLVFVFLVIRLGVYRPVAAFYALAAISFPIVWVAGTSPSRADSNLARTASAKDYRPPRFPALGPTQQIAPGVEFRRVRLPVQSGQPGSASTLYVYLPGGDHANRSLPCIFIASAGAMAFTGMELTAEDRPEHIPYVKEGFAVIAYEIDGYVRELEAASEHQLTEAILAYWASGAGITNARNAIEFAMARIPQIDPNRLYCAGHSSAGTQSLLLAENEPRIKACIAYAPVVDLESRVRANLPTYRATIDDFDDLLQLASPKAHESQLKCPVFLFHARDDQNIPAEESTALANRLRQSGKTVELVVVPSGGHYDSMISQGIPRAITWLKKYAGRLEPPSQTPSRSPARPAPGDLAKRPFKERHSDPFKPFDENPFKKVDGGKPPAGMSSGGDGPLSEKAAELEKQLNDLMAKSDSMSPTELQRKALELMRDRPAAIQHEVREKLQRMMDDRAKMSDSGSDTAKDAGDLFAESPFKKDHGPGEKGSVGTAFSEKRIRELIDKMTTGNVFERRDAIKQIVRIRPESVASQEVQQLVRKTLHDLAMTKDHFTQKDAITALGKWGDSSSVDLLLGMLADKSSQSFKREIFRVLGQLKDPRAAVAAAERLSDFFDRDEAEACLRAMGSIAEDALILVAPSNNKDACLRAVTLLGDVGTDKCMSVLRKAQSSRNVEVREAAKMAMRKVRLRQSMEEKPDDK